MKGITSTELEEALLKYHYAADSINQISSEVTKLGKEAVSLISKSVNRLDSKNKVYAITQLY